MFLAGSQPDGPPAAAADSTGAENGAANRQPAAEDGEQPSSVSPPQTRTAHAAVRSNKEHPRSDSPGYFTLSDSDGASNPGTESPQEDEVKASGLKVQGQRRDQPRPQNQKQQQQQQRHQVYKMFKSPSRPLSTSAAPSPRTGKPVPAARPNSDREKSRTPPRPSPPKGYCRRDSCGSDRGMTPPRPPPPLSYTSTLPPPVPKKTRPKTPTKTAASSAKTTASQQEQHFKTIPAVRRNSSGASSANRKSSPAGSATAAASKTLPRVQPLQMQSPSMIKALTKSVSAATDPTPPLPPKERKSPPKEKAHPTPKKPKTFVQAFHGASQGSSINSNVNRASPPRGKGPSISPRPTKTSTARASSSSSRTSPGKETSSSQPPRSPSEPGNSSRRSSVVSTKSSAEALKKAVMKTLQVNGRQSESKSNKKGAAAAKGGDTLLGKESKNSLERIGSETPKSKSPSPRRSSKSLSATAIEKIRERRNRSKDRARKGDDGDRERGKDSSILPKKINSLIKHYESGAKEKRKDDDETPASNRSSGLTASQLSRLSQLSADELHSWLSSPMSSANLDKSMTEIDVLDQCVSEMMSFTTDALTTATDTDSDTLKSGVFLNLLEHQRTETDDDDVRRSVQEIIDKIEGIEQRPPVKPERTRKREKVTASPSDDDLSHGVFTEVSFAGSFSSGVSVVVPEAPKEAAEVKVASPPPLPAKRGNFGDDVRPKAPIPSPRTKRRARKEQMLLEHKEKGREALSILKSQSASCVPDSGAPPRPPSPVKASASHQDGLECLEQLCSMSRGIERESGIPFRSRPPPAARQAGSPTEDDDCDDKDAKSCGARDEGKVCRSRFSLRSFASIFLPSSLTLPSYSCVHPWQAILWRPFAFVLSSGRPRVTFAADRWWRLPQCLLGL